MYVCMYITSDGEETVNVYQIILICICIYTFYIKSYQRWNIYIYIYIYIYIPFFHHVISNVGIRLNLEGVCFLCSNKHRIPQNPSKSLHYDIVESLFYIWNHLRHCTVSIYSYPSHSLPNYILPLDLVCITLSGESDRYTKLSETVFLVYPHMYAFTTKVSWVLSMTRNCIKLWGSDSRTLQSIKYPLY